MRKGIVSVIDLEEINIYRFRGAEALRYGRYGDSNRGVFLIPSKVRGGEDLRIIADTGEGWDHVSVSTKNRTPTWEEMDMVKRLFFKRDEVVMQLHVAVDDHINIHSHVLHLWRPTNGCIPMPPKNRV